MAAKQPRTATDELAEEQPRTATEELAEVLKEHSLRKLSEYLKTLREVGTQQETIVFTSREDAWISSSNPFIIETDPLLEIPGDTCDDEARLLVIMVTYRRPLIQTIYSVNIVSGRELHFMMTFDPMLVVRVNALNEEPRKLYQPGSESSWFMTVGTESQSSLNMEVLDFYPKHTDESSSSSSSTEGSISFTDDRASSRMDREPSSPMDSPMKLSRLDRAESLCNSDFCMSDVEIERPHRKDGPGIH